MQGKPGEPAYLEDWNSTETSAVAGGESKFSDNFDFDEEIGKPGPVLIKNHHHSEFYLKTVTVEHVPGHGRIHFVCNSWVYPDKRYQKPRVFFTNKTYLPHEMPESLRKYREEEMKALRGNGQGELQEWDRVYDYAYNNDLGNPDKGPNTPTRFSTDPFSTHHRTESRIPLLMSSNIYVPRDERFGHLKMSYFLAYALKSIVQFIIPELQDLTDKTHNEFDSFEDVLKLYYGGVKLPSGPLLDNIINNIPLEMLKEIFRTDGAQLLKFPVPQTAWRTDEEFAREMLAGVNPVMIRLLEEFPPTSKLNPKVYDNQNSAITKEHIEHNLEGLTIEEALTTNRLFILDHHDSLMPYLRRINSTTTKTYASRTILFLRNDGTLKPLAIELSLPHPSRDQLGASSKVYTPAEHGVEGSIWQLAKAYVAVNDSGVHQLISHWYGYIKLNTRQLSAVHPIYKLLHPHFRDTMNINAFARQALPRELKKRGVAVDDNSSPNDLRLLIKDYPYAVDGLEIWFAIEKWVTDYCSFYNKTDKMVGQDPELQAWWKELREKGHGDKKDEPCQYPYAGYLPNRPTISRQFMPEEGTPEYAELKSNPNKAFLKTITAQLQTLLGISLIEILSRHSSDEFYPGQRDSTEWTSDETPFAAFDEFGEWLSRIEERIVEMNNNKLWKNRVGPVNVPYTLFIVHTMVDAAIKAMSSTKDDDDVFMRVVEALDSIDKPQFTPDTRMPLFKSTEPENGCISNPKKKHLISGLPRNSEQVPSELITCFSNMISTLHRNAPASILVAILC
ncbi:Linoleate 9S-lipoxygenase A [Hibiscus syriacus]|uniref:Lipoxygenase n=1 Tax=Hibiscus syriacus TaxID=106335 RepID=A0A6A3CYF0_HIBSY|nr:Linoleate 9S-lipoxygenase A [Hibiscus syriacus]